VNHLGGPSPAGAVPMSLAIEELGHGSTGQPDALGCLAAQLPHALEHGLLGGEGAIYNQARTSAGMGTGLPIARPAIP
jgi:hypothetical protein